MHMEDVSNLWRVRIPIACPIVGTVTSWDASPKNRKKNNCQKRKDRRMKTSCPDRGLSRYGLISSSEINLVNFDNNKIPRKERWIQNIEIVVFNTKRTSLSLSLLICFYQSLPIWSTIQSYTCNWSIRSLQLQCQDISQIEVCNLHSNHTEQT